MEVAETQATQNSNMCTHFSKNPINLLKNIFAKEIIKDFQPF